MKVWWCEEHKSLNHTYARCGWVIIEGNGINDDPCRMVEMQLVPADAQMVSGEQQCPNCKFVYETEPPKDPWDYDP